jgi:hypothetical protein
MRRQAGGAQAGGYGRPVPTAPAGDSAEAGRVSRPTPRNWSWTHPTGAYEVETKILKQPDPWRQWRATSVTLGETWAKTPRASAWRSPQALVFVGCGGRI